jgi:hypothetical protein
MKSATTTSLPFIRKLLHPVPERCVLVWFPCMHQYIPTQADETAGTPLAQPKAVSDILGSFAPRFGPRFGLQKFFATTVFNA